MCSTCPFGAQAPTNPMRLIGVGTMGRRFAEQFHGRAVASLPTPLGNLLVEAPTVVEIAANDPRDASEHVDTVDLDETRIVYLAFDLNIRPAEIEAAMLLTWRMWAQDGHVLGIVLQARDHPWPSSESMLGILLESMDARSDILCLEDLAETTPLQWLYLSLRQAGVGSLSLGGAAFDHSDVVEALGFRQVQVDLVTQPLSRLVQLDVALTEALKVLLRRGVRLPRTRGAVVILWVPAAEPLHGGVARRIGQALTEALGTQALQLAIQMGSELPSRDVRSFLTLAISTPSPALQRRPFSTA